MTIDFIHLNLSVTVRSMCSTSIYPAYIFDLFFPWSRSRLNVHTQNENYKHINQHQKSIRDKLQLCTWNGCSNLFIIILIVKSTYFYDKIKFMCSLRNSHIEPLSVISTLVINLLEFQAKQFSIVFKTNIQAKAGRSMLINYNDLKYRPIYILL